jgi:hypothetical protein
MPLISAIEEGELAVLKKLSIRSSRGNEINYIA